MYWCAASSGGDGELVEQKWLSILNHVTDVHEGHGEKFPRCEHGELEERDWMKRGRFADCSENLYTNQYPAKCFSYLSVLTYVSVLKRTASLRQFFFEPTMYVLVEK